MKHIFLIVMCMFVLLTACGTAVASAERREEKLAEIEAATAERVASAEVEREAEQAEREAEQAAQEAEEEATRRAEEEADAARSPRERLIRDTLRITSLRTSRPNSVGGVDVSIGYENRSEETIKYMDVTFRAYNAVGDRVSCRIRRTSQFEGRITGPINQTQGGQRSGNWSCAWYNNSISHAEITNIRIEYMNGTIFTLSGQDIVWTAF